jgi:GNAT superfamily N-acetyltransferase
MAPIEPAGLPDGLTSRPLTVADIPGCLALSAEAGWNQNAIDWGYMIGRGPGWACCDSTGHVMATALTLPYGDQFGWIGMVLVTADWQRRGLASRLLEAAIAALLDLGITPGLDATEAGRQVYLPLGFQDIYPLSRYQIAQSETSSKLQIEEGYGPMTRGDLLSLAETDAAVFGSDRQDLLRDLLNRAPGMAWISEDGRDYALGRDGRRASQLGPIIADDTASAISLVGNALGRKTGPVFIDVPDHHENFRAWLEAAGFHRQRGFMRMLYGRNEAFDDPARVFAIAGPELG